MIKLMDLHSKLNFVFYYIPIDVKENLKSDKYRKWTSTLEFLFLWLSKIEMTKGFKKWNTVVRIKSTTLH